MTGHEMTRLGEVMEITSGFAFKSSYFSTSTSGLPLVRIRDVARGYSDTRYNGPYNDRYLVDDGDLLVSMDGEFRVRPWSGGPALLNQRVCRLEPDPNRLCKNYLRHLIAPELKRIEDRTPFVTVKHLAAKTVLAIEVPLPKLAEQQRITAILDKAEAAGRRRRISLRLLESLRLAQFHQVFGSLRQTGRTNVQDLREIGRTNVQDPREIGRTNVQDLREANKSGDVVTVGDALDSGILLEVQDGNHGSGHPKTDEFQTEGVPFVAASCLAGNRLNLDDCPRLSRDRTAQLRTGFSRRFDVLLTHKASLGMTCVVPESIDLIMLTPQVTYYRCNTTRLNPYYLSTFFQTPFFQSNLRRRAKQSTRAYIGITRQKDLPLRVPPIETQNTFAHFVRKLDASIADYETSRRESDHLFESLVGRAFRGELS